jgi:hypothetical protein
MKMERIGDALVSSAVFAGIGLVVLALAIVISVRLPTSQKPPDSFRHYSASHAIS